MLRLQLRAALTPFGDMQLEAQPDDPDARQAAVWQELRRRMEADLPVQGRVLNMVPGGTGAFAVGVGGFVALLERRYAALDAAKSVGTLRDFYIMAMDGDGVRRRAIRLCDAASLSLRRGAGGGRGRPLQGQQQQ